MTMNAAATPGPVPLSALLDEARAELALEVPPPMRLPAKRWGQSEPRAPRYALIAALALLLLSVLLVVTGAPPRPAQPLAGGAFVALAPMLAPGPMADAAAQPAWTVATEMPRERLAQLGLPFDPGRAGELVRAELLIDRRGDVLAVRPLTLRQRLD